MVYRMDNNIPPWPLNKFNLHAEKDTLTSNMFTYKYIIFIVKKVEMSNQVLS